AGKYGAQLPAGPIVRAASTRLLSPSRSSSPFRQRLVTASSEILDVLAYRLRDANSMWHGQPAHGCCTQQRSTDFGDSVEPYSVDSTIPARRENILQNAFAYAIAFSTEYSRTSCVHDTWAGSPCHKLAFRPRPR